MAGIADVAGHLCHAGRHGTFHGKGGARTQFDGMSVQNMTGNAGYQLNAALVQEMTLQSSGISAEGNAEGMLINMIPKEGGNTFSGSIFGLYTNDDLAGDNLTDELRSARAEHGQQAAEDLRRRQSALGGPIKRDKLWFFTSLREWGNAHQMAGFYWNKTQGSPFYTPDLDRPATRNQWFESFAGRVTWQATQAHKFNVFADVQDACICRTGTTGGSGVGRPRKGSGLPLPANRFLPGFLERAASPTGCCWTAPSRRRSTTGRSSGRPASSRSTSRSSSSRPACATTRGKRYDDPNVQERFGQRFSVSYVTGSHAFKFGFQNEQGDRRARSGAASTGNVSYTFNNARPGQSDAVRDAVRAAEPLQARPRESTRRINGRSGV